jgi:hypothetical protein
MAAVAGRLGARRLKISPNRDHHWRGALHRRQPRLLRKGGCSLHSAGPKPRSNLHTPSRPVLARALLIRRLGSRNHVGDVASWHFSDPGDVRLESEVGPKADIDQIAL